MPGVTPLFYAPPSACHCAPPTSQALWPFFLHSRAFVTRAGNGRDCGHPRRSNSFSSSWSSPHLLWAEAVAAAARGFAASWPTGCMKLPSPSQPGNPDGFCPSLHFAHESRHHHSPPPLASQSHSRRWPPQLGKAVRGYLRPPTRCHKPSSEASSPPLPRSGDLWYWRLLRGCDARSGGQWRIMFSYFTLKKNIQCYLLCD